MVDPNIVTPDDIVWAGECEHEYVNHPAFVSDIVMVCTKCKDEIVDPFGIHSTTRKAE